MNPLSWIDAIVMWGAHMPHTVFALLWAKAVTVTLVICDRRPFPARAYYAVYTFAQTFGGFLAAAWLMRAIHG